MPTPKRSEETLQRALDAVERYGGVSQAARALGVIRETFYSQYRAAKKAKLTVSPPPKFTTPELPDDDLTAEEIIAHRKKVFDRKIKATDARKLVDIKLNVPGPLALVIFGDIHIDDDGCNWPILERDMGLVNSTDGMFCGAIGDLQNGWVGRLSRLWAAQSTTGKQAWRLVQWWLEEMSRKLLFVVEGNHDAWCKGVNGVSPINWMMNFHPGVSESDGVRLRLVLPEGDPVILNARHDFAGRSQYNNAHGPTKAALFGFRDDDVLIAGHTHVSGYNPMKNPATGKTTHPVRVASYKAIDDHAKERGFLDGNISESVAIMIDPHEEDIRHRIWIENSIPRAARVLKHLRNDFSKRKK